MKNCTMIINPNSGRKNTKLNLKRIEKIFENHGYLVNIIFTSYKGHAQSITKDIKTDLLVSVGGDGTFNEVMTGNFKRKKRLLIAHIPIGTANDIGAMYGYGWSIYHNIKILLEGKVKKIDICTINNQPFTYVAALGKFTNISYDTPRHLKKKYGYFAYLIEGLKDLKNQFKIYDLEYEIDKKVYSGKFTCMLVSNANRIAGINNFYHDIKLDDDRFEILFCEMSNPKEIIKSLYHLKDGDISTLDGFRFYKTNNLKMHFKNALSKGWSIDGEEFKDKNSDFEIKVVRNVEILIPTKNIEKLFIDKE